MSKIHYHMERRDKNLMRERERERERERRRRGLHRYHCHEQYFPDFFICAQVFFIIIAFKFKSIDCKKTETILYNQREDSPDVIINIKQETH